MTGHVGAEHADVWQCVFDTCPAGIGHASTGAWHVAASQKGGNQFSIKDAMGDNDDVIAVKKGVDAGSAHPNQYLHLFCPCPDIVQALTLLEFE